ncbi:hypothetical protein niasHT_018592 [Heterodera trifolii]|uniref:Uncharacterized protein n=1 Tax=Heterodera trifolii TaxID=157864 RepID=A0ABD2LBL4_9BILA
MPRKSNNDGFSRYPRRLRQTDELGSAILENNNRLKQYKSERRGGEPHARALRHRQVQMIDSYERALRRLAPDNRRELVIKFPTMSDIIMHGAHLSSMEQYQQQTKDGPRAPNMRSQVVVVPNRQEEEREKKSGGGEKREEKGEKETEEAKSDAKEREGEKSPPAARKEGMKCPPAAVVGITTRRPMAEWDELEWHAQNVFEERRAKVQAEEDEKRWQQRTEKATKALEEKMAEILAKAKE